MKNELHHSSQKDLDERLASESRFAQPKIPAIAEYTSLGLSAAGTVVSIITKQAAYATAPLSVSLFLSLLNRQQLRQRVEQQVQQTTSQIQHLNQTNGQLEPTLASLTEQLGELRQQVAAQAANRPDFKAEVRAEVEQAQLAIAEQCEALEISLQASLKHALQRVNEVAALAETAAAQKPKDFTPEIEQLRGIISQQQEALEQSQHALEASLKSSLKDLLQTSLDESLQESLQDVAPRSSLERMQAGLADYLGRTQAVSVQLQQLQERLSAYINEHQGEVAELRQSLEAIATVQPVVQSVPPTSKALLEPETKPEPELESELEPELEPEPEFDPEVVPPADSVELPTDIGLDLLFLNLGIDFGTRFTKVCFQNISDDRSEIIPFRNDHQTIQDVLLATQVGILPDGRLFAGLTEGEWQNLQASESDLMVLDGLKMRLADLDLGTQEQPWRLEAFPELDEPENVENLCAYYLSQVIRRSQGWIRSNCPQLVARQKIEWSANVGVPVAYCDSVAGERFQRVLSLAWRLSNEPKTQELTLQVLQDYMVGLRSQPVADNCRAIPEVAAGAWSFLNTRQAGDNFYLFFDIGDGSLDGCALHFYRKDDAQIDFYHGQVEPLGVRAFSQRLAQELLLSEQEAHALLERTENQPDFHRSKARKLLQQKMVQVISQGGKEYQKHYPIQRDQEFEAGLSVFLLGGGSQLDFFRRILPETHKDFRQEAAGIGVYRTRELPRPDNLQFNGIQKRDFYRFSVAYGLATPYEDLISRVRLPKEVTSEVVIGSEENTDDRLSYEDERGSW